MSRIESRVLAAIVAVEQLTLASCAHAVAADADSFSVIDLLSRSELLKRADPNIQFVERFSEIVSFHDNPIEAQKLMPGSDYRHVSNGWRSAPYWFRDKENLPGGAEECHGTQKGADGFCLCRVGAQCSAP